MLFAFQFASGQEDSLTNQKAEIRSYGAGIQHGFIFAHSEAVENTKGSRPTGVELTLSKQRIDSAIWQLCNCYPRRGLLFSFYDYDNKVLGKSVTAAYFLEPVYRLSNRLSFSLKGAAGLSYLSNPFDSIYNQTNLSYSTHISVYLQLGTGLWYRLNDHWSLNTSVSYNHESNGGMKEPNKGINWPTAGLGISYQPDNPAYFRGSRTRDKFRNRLPLRWDITAFTTARRDVDDAGKSNRLMLYGMGVQLAKQIGRISNLTVGIEGSIDEEIKLELKRDTLDASNMLAGLTAGHEFILGRILFSQKLGIYLFDQTPYHDRLYHRWALMYRINQHWSAGFSLKAHKHVADYGDLRVSYSF
ncbi:MAG TPA: acyloxyacyl hydrolase [Chitinophagaceae bacterium]